MPDYNPYTISQCRTCPVAKGDGKATLAAFIPQSNLCEACQLVRVCYRDKTEKSERKRIDENKKMYDKLSKDSRYTEVEFNHQTGALKAIHRGHNTGASEGLKLEIKLINKLFDCGHSIILCDESRKGRNGNVLPSLDMILDGVRMDIKSVTKNKAHYGAAIRSKNKQIVKYNARTDVHEPADTMCLYFDEPSMFSPDKITNGYKYMKAKTSRDAQIRHIMCVINSAKGLEIKTFDF